MVIDDETVWRELCAEKLAAMGHEVSTCGDCSEALVEIRRDPPDLVVLDLRMPISGRSMLNALRQDRPDLPVIIHTVYSAYRDDPGLASNAHFAVKSPDLRELTAAVCSHVARRRRGSASGRGAEGAHRRADPR